MIQAVALLTIACLLAATLVLSILTMLALSALEAIAATWRRLKRIFR